jgi:hypothetical protein
MIIMTSSFKKTWWHLLPNRRSFIIESVTYLVSFRLEYKYSNCKYIWVNYNFLVLLVRKTESRPKQFLISAFYYTVCLCYTAKISHTVKIWAKTDEPFTSYLRNHFQKSFYIFSKKMSFYYNVNFSWTLHG